MLASLTPTAAPQAAGCKPTLTRLANYYAIWPSGGEASPWDIVAPRLLGLIRGVPALYSKLSYGSAAAWAEEGRAEVLLGEGGGAGKVGKRLEWLSGRGAAVAGAAGGAQGGCRLCS